MAAIRARGALAIKVAADTSAVDVNFSLIGPDIKDKDVTITHTLTSMFCPMADAISAGIKSAVEKVDGIGNVKVKLTHTPPFTKEMMSDEARFSLGL